MLGGLALAIGGGLLLSDSLVGQDLLTEITGILVEPRRMSCAIVFCLGALTLGLSNRNTKEPFETTEQ
jgi:hypothetical protein